MRIIAPEHAITLSAKFETLTPSQSLNPPPTFRLSNCAQVMHDHDIEFLGLRATSDLVRSLLLIAAQVILEETFWYATSLTAAPLPSNPALPALSCSFVRTIAAHLVVPVIDLAGPARSHVRSTLP